MAAVAVLAACGGGGGEAREYGPEARNEFVDACSAGGDASQDACRCFYDRLAAEVPFERFEQIDARIRDDAADIPGDIVDMAVECSVVRSAPGG